MQKRKGKKLASILIAASMVTAALAPQAIVYADSTRVVTLGADLSEERKEAILKYFGISTANVETIYVTNTDERDLLSSFIPLDVIGTRTLSCAYVNPTKSGGIQVKTANLTWVTSNMIASALSTSGVTNCEVIAACPIPVSGTGALAGVLKAYESAAGEVLDATKKEIAAQEIVTTSDLAETVGQDEATKIVNEIKIQVIEDDIDYYDDDYLHAIVEDAIASVLADAQAERDELLSITEEQRQQLEDLATRIAEQDYNYDDVKVTLERIEDNVSKGSDVNVNVNITNEGSTATATAQGGDTSVSTGDTSVATGDTSVSTGGTTVSTGDTSVATGDTSVSTGDSQNELPADSIFLNTDKDAIGGEEVIEDATTTEAITTTEQPAQEAAPEQTQDTGADGSNAGGDLFEIVTTDQGVYTEDGNAVEETSSEGLQDNTLQMPSADETQGTDTEVFPVETIDETIPEPTDTYTEQPAETYTEQPAETVTEQPAETYTDQPAETVTEQPADQVDTTEWPTDETVIETTDEGGINAEPDVTEITDNTDDWTDTENTDDDWTDETGDTADGGDGTETEPVDEAPAAVLPQLKVGSGSFNGFALKLYTDSKVVPASGAVTFTDENGTETRIDLAESGAYGVLPAESWELSETGFSEGYAIYVLTDKISLAGGQYHVKADIVFADADDAGKPVAGTEKDLVSAESDLTYVASSLVPQRPEGGYVAPTTATLRAYAPEGTVSADVTSSDESVAYPGIFTMDESSGLVDIDLEASGVASISVTYFNEGGEAIGQDGLEIAAF